MRIKGLGLGVVAAFMAAGALAQSGAAWAQASPVTEPTGAASSNYDSTQGFPDRDGPFSAMLVVIPQSELVEFRKPQAEGRNLSRVARAEPGAVLAFKILFTGVERDVLSMTDVSYDLQVFRPDGRIYGQSDYRDIPALRSQPDQTDLLFDNGPQVVMLQFEPEDMPGVYVVRATLKDNVSGRRIPLETQLELIPAQSVASAPPVSPPTGKPVIGKPTIKPLSSDAAPETVAPASGPMPYLTLTEPATTSAPVSAKPTTQTASTQTPSTQAAVKKKPAAKPATPAAKPAPTAKKPPKLRDVR